MLTTKRRLLSAPQLLQASSALKIPAERGPHSTVLHAVEGLALVLLCSCQLSTRRLAIAILREIRSLFVTIKQSEVRDKHKQMERGCQCHVHVGGIYRINPPPE